MSVPKPVCLKAEELRKIGIQDLEVYLADPDNQHICRRGRVFIGSGAAKHVFSYKQSMWANPYKVAINHHTLEESLAKYEKHLDGLLTEDEYYNKFLELREAKRIGCFCPLGQPCHRDVIIRRMKKNIAAEKATDELLAKQDAERQSKRAKVAKKESNDDDE